MADDPVRREGERLVAAALAAASMAARGLSAARGRAGDGFATGGPECCVCPVCRVIAALRDPDPELALRLAVGAGDLATTLASVFRAVANRGAAADAGPTRAGDEFWESLRERARTAAAEPDPAGGERDGRPGDPWRAATLAAQSPPAAPAPVVATAVAKKAVAKKAVAKKAVAQRAMAAQPGGKAGAAKAGAAKAGAAKGGAAKGGAAKAGAAKAGAAKGGGAGAPRTGPGRPRGAPAGGGAE